MSFNPLLSHNVEILLAMLQGISNSICSLFDRINMEHLGVTQMQCNQIKGIDSHDT